VGWGVRKRSFRQTLKLPLPHSTGFGEPLPSPTGLKGVGFLQACLLAALPSSASLPPCERDARAPSPRCAGNAGVPPATPTAREKTYPSNTNRASEVHQLPPSCRFPPLREGNRERRAYSVPPARRGNLEEGVLVYPYFCELWLGDWYKLPQGGRGVGGEGRKYEPPRYRQGGRVSQPCASMRLLFGDAPCADIALMVIA
jgi:hypothetical protein